MDPAHDRAPVSVADIMPATIRTPFFSRPALGIATGPGFSIELVLARGAWFARPRLS